MYVYPNFDSSQNSLTAAGKAETKGDRGGMGWELGRRTLSLPLCSILLLPAFFSPHPQLESLFVGYILSWS